MRSLSTAVKPSTANKKIKQNNFFKKGKTQWAGEAQAEGGWGLLPVMAQCPHVHIDSCGVWASCALQGEQRNVRSNLMPIVSRGVACTQAQLLPAGGQGGGGKAAALPPAGVCLPPNTYKTC